ncbi:MAG: hypothetical protein JWP76_1240 [Dactylosporangium sp.]|jgi:hypothetical protein|nr:hypothetical protein [Dactylosporangium sp.]
MELETDAVRPQWLTWPTGAVAALAWGLGRLTHIAFFDLIVVAALTCLGGWLLSDFAYRYLVRTGQLPQGDGRDQPEVDERR